MKILHTSDWHIGRTLNGRKRYAEHEAFLNWLARTVDEENVDAVLISGDVFDNTTPSNAAQELYYRFLCRVAGSSGRQVVVIAGNHDSPSFLKAPKELLKHIHIQVFACAAHDPADEVTVLCAMDGRPGMIVCAVPYLRDTDLRTAEAGESLEDKERKMIGEIKNHYLRVCEAAMKIRERLQKPLPIVAMGHLFAAGGRTLDGDGVRHLSVGTLAQVGKEVFPDVIDYLALGHLHVPQRVGGSEVMRYCGSPLPMGFGEAGQEKKVVLVNFENREPDVSERVVPLFQELKTLRGDWFLLSRDIQELKFRKSRAWLEVIYDGEEMIGDLRERLEEATSGTDIAILSVKNSRWLHKAFRSETEVEALDALDINDVFSRCLDACRVPGEQRPVLWSAYQEMLASLDEEDPLAT